MLGTRVITIPIHTILVFTTGEEKYKYGIQKEAEEFCGVGMN